jgi:ELWxxDGT repeat protein
MKTSRRAALLVSLLACLGPAAAAPAGTPHLLLDVNSGPPDMYDRYTGYLPPTQFATVQGRAVLLVGGSTASPQLTLWASDGTSEGTELLAAFCTADFEGCDQGGRFLGQANGVEFVAIPEEGYQNDYHLELWRTDGTREGTFRLPAEICVTDFYHENGATETIAGGALYFAGIDAVLGCRPWRSDGTVTGTGRLESRRPENADRSPYAFAALGDKAFFATDSGLWTVDSRAGAVRLLRALPGVRLITSAGSRLFFLSATDDGEALWVSDGETGGDTRQLRDLPESRCRDCDLPLPFLRPLAGGVVFLVADPLHDYASRLWRSDGTERGTYPVGGLPHPVHFGNGYFVPETFAEAGSRMIFPAARKRGEERLWTASLPPVSASPLAGCPAGCPIVTSPLQPLPSGKVVFTGSASGSPEALWVSDGTAEGTRPLANPCPGGCSSSANFVILGSAVYLGVEDAGGHALWRTDGTREGTVLLARVALPFEPGGTLLGDQAFLGVSNGVRISELWATDGSPGGTRHVRTFGRAAASSNPAFAPFGDGVLFTAAQDASTRGWWWSDGTSTRKLTTFCPACFFQAQQVTTGGLAFVLTGGLEQIGIYAPHLIRTDGTRAGTREILALDSDSFVRSPFSFAGRFFFLRCDTDYAEPGTILRRCGFWSSDGTPEGTGPRIPLPVLSDITPPVVVDGSFYFTLSTRDGFFVYQSDGTRAGTRPIVRFSPYGYYPVEIAGAGGWIFLALSGEFRRLNAAAPEGTDFIFGGYVSGLRELNGRLLFFGSDGREPARAGLWSTDGTPEGTRFLAPVLPEALTSYPFLGPPEWTRLGSRLVFRGLDPEHGFELWATDGTAEGTVLLQDIAPGKTSSFPTSLVRVGDQVWLTADDGDHGRELWVTDGTPEGTRLALDLAPGPFSLEPLDLTPGGGSLFFSADTLFNGREPWVLPLQ